jgi:hypothetical protein
VDLTETSARASKQRPLSQLISYAIAAYYNASLKTYASPSCICCVLCCPCRSGCATISADATPCFPAALAGLSALLSQLVLPPGQELLPVDLKQQLPPACLELVTQVTLQEGSATPQLQQAADGE